MDLKKLTLDERAQCAAYMRANHDMSQNEIGQVLGGLSQPQVSRLLTHAEKQNYLVIQQRFASELFSNDWLRKIDELLAPEGLSAVLSKYCRNTGVYPPSIRVFESGPGDTKGALVHRRARFGRTAAGRLIELIEKSSIVGVAWGRTIKSLADGIAASRQPLRNTEHITFSPVCAELVSLAQHGYSSSRLADNLDELFNDAPGNSPQLTGIPAYIPRHYDTEMRASIWRFIADTPGHSRVYSGPDALIHRMDMLISSIGSANTPVLGSFDELISAGGLKASDLRQLVVGDLGGILLPKIGLSKAKQTLVDDLNELWTGMKTEHVHRIAERAFADHRLSGVVVVAIQAERGDTAFELISRGLVNELILDHAAAARLQQRLTDELAS